jgi:hypothetical protein
MGDTLKALNDIVVFAAEQAMIAAIAREKGFDWETAKAFYATYDPGDIGELVSAAGMPDFYQDILDELN